MKRILAWLLTGILASSSLSAQPKAANATGAKISAAAKAQIGVTTSYDPAYVALAYPGGDVPSHPGVCSDVVVRALRALRVQRIDLQKEVHEDMKANFRIYPQNWGLKKPDKNIDHRRVPNLMRYFERKQIEVAGDRAAADAYLPGDIVAWRLENGLPHVGVVSDRKEAGIPLMIHNIGRGAQEENVLFAFRVIGHYRLKETARVAGGSE